MSSPLTTHFRTCVHALSFVVARQLFDLGDNVIGGSLGKFWWLVAGPCQSPGDLSAFNNLSQTLRRVM